MMRAIAFSVLHLSHQYLQNYIRVFLYRNFHLMKRMEEEHLKLQLAGVAPKEFPAAKLFLQQISCLEIHDV